MSSYFDHYCKNVDQHNRRDTEQIHGTCYAMCPQDEIQLRQKERLVHVLEVLGPQRRLVKSYSRSAADSNMAVAHHLRPYGVLWETVQYLILDILRRVDVQLVVIYDFVNDRLRAVRQDMTIQRLVPAECARLLEPMIRFYVYFGYKFNGRSLNDFDPVLNKKYTLECIKWFLSSCDSIDQQQSNTNGKIDDLTNALDHLGVNGNGESYDRVLVESLYILCNLEDMYPMYRYLKLSKDLKMDPRLQLAYKVAVANLRGNFVRVSKLLNKLCSLSYCAVCQYLPAMQRRALAVLSHAYHSKQLAVASPALARWISVASEWEARAIAQHYGLEVVDRDVRFDKGDYNNNASMHSTKVQFLHNETPNLNMEYVFTYKL